MHIEGRLKKAGLSITAQRIAVMKEVSAQPHCSADYLIKAVGERLGKISRQATYDILHSLTEKGLLRAIQPAGSPALYEDRIGDNHHHVICRVCGELRDVDCSVGRMPCLHPVEDHGYDIDEAEVVYWGICPDCKKINSKP